MMPRRRKIVYSFDGKRTSFIMTAALGRRCAPFSHRRSVAFDQRRCHASILRRRANRAEALAPHDIRAQLRLASMARAALMAFDSGGRSAGCRREVPWLAL